MRQPAMLTALRSFPVLLRLFAPAFLLGGALLVTGCGEAGAKDSISGTCKMKNGDKVSGTVTFVSGGKEFMGPLLDGKYTVTNVPKGECDVLVKGMGGAAVGPAPIIPKDSAKATDAKMAVSPPEKYSKPGALPKYTVKGGKETHDITLD